MSARLDWKSKPGNIDNGTGAWVSVTENLRPLDSPTRLPVARKQRRLQGCNAGVPPVHSSGPPWHFFSFCYKDPKCSSQYSTWKSNLSTLGVIGDSILEFARLVESQVQACRNEGKAGLAYAARCCGRSTLICAECACGSEVIPSYNVSHPVASHVTATRNASRAEDTAQWERGSVLDAVAPAFVSVAAGAELELSHLHWILKKVSILHCGNRKAPTIRSFKDGP